MSSDVGVAIEVRNISKDYRMWRSPQARLESPLWNLLSRGAPPASRLANGLRRKFDADAYVERVARLKAAATT